MTYRVKCEENAKATMQWALCGKDVVVLPNSVGLNSTSVFITGLNPQHDYRLSVQACNDISKLLKAPATSTATLIIHKCK